MYCNHLCAQWSSRTTPWNRVHRQSNKHSLKPVFYLLFQRSLLQLDLTAKNNNRLMKLHYVDCKGYTVHTHIRKNYAFEIFIIFSVVITQYFSIIGQFLVKSILGLKNVKTVNELPIILVFSLSFTPGSCPIRS